jgi:hypothetical protein
VKVKGLGRSDHI